VLKPGLGAFSHVTLGVASLDEATAFWVNHFGLEVEQQQRGADAALARIWQLPATAIAAQAVLATPGAKAGRLHIVEFSAPGTPVREGAEAYDLLPKNLDVYAPDLPQRYDELKAAGIEFRGPWIGMPGPDGLSFREAHLPGHDEINVVLLEVIGPGYATPLTRQGFAAMGPLITIVPDAERETAFYRDLLGMDTTLEILLKGEQIEKMIGLPPGAGLDLRIFGDAADPMGRIELIEYQQVKGKNLYPRARPPARGILHAGYQIADLDPLRQRLGDAGVSFEEHGAHRTLLGSGALISFHSPAGFRLEVQER